MEAQLHFFRGDDNRVVIEEESSNSIFADQYAVAKCIIEDIVKSQGEDKIDVSNVVAFCGDRGTGKTSCMLSLQQQIKDKFFVINRIDPSFFDDDHDIIDLVLGRLFEEVCGNGTSVKENQRELLKKFAEVKCCLKDLGRSKSNIYDAVEDVSIISAGLALRDKIWELFELILKGTSKSKILITIDDLDTKVNYAYAMSEQIRKYLSTSNCIVLISINEIQLERLICMDLQKERHELNDIQKGWYMEAAHKYVLKFMPIGQRVIMPSFTEYNVNEVAIHESYEEAVTDFLPLQENVLRLIFRKTRYLFYNKVGEICPIIPRNLRQLRQLVGLLVSMSDFKNNKESIANKYRFKTYFYDRWKKEAKQSEQEMVSNVINIEDIQQLNWIIVRDYLPGLELQLQGSENTKDQSVSKSENNINSISDSTISSVLEIPKLFEPEKLDLYRYITSSKNYHYNISTGDVFLLLEQYEQRNADNRHVLNMLFYLRSYYSIVLYDAYDLITEKKGYLYPEPSIKLQTVKSDSIFGKMNVLQRLTNGSYFTYNCGDILPDGMDLYVINFRLSDQYSTMNASIPWSTELKMLEFFCLATWCVTIDHIKDIEESKRVDRRPFYLEPLPTNEGILLFDILAIFGNVQNLRTAYSKVSDDFYNIANAHEDSLLRAMMDISKRDHALSADKIEAREQIGIHEGEANLISNAIIRNSEILTHVKGMAITKGAKSYDDARDLATPKRYAAFYKKMIETDMKTFDFDEGQAYSIRFAFLQAIVDLLNDVDASVFDSYMGAKINKLDVE